MFTFFAPLIITLSVFTGAPRDNLNTVEYKAPTVSGLGQDTNIIYKKAPLNLVKSFNK